MGFFFGGGTESISASFVRFVCLCDMYLYLSVYLYLEIDSANRWK